MCTATVSGRGVLSLSLQLWATADCLSDSLTPSLGKPHVLSSISAKELMCGDWHALAACALRNCPPPHGHRRPGSRTSARCSRSCSLPCLLIHLHPRDPWVRVPSPTRHTELSQAIPASFWEILRQRDGHLTWTPNTRVATGPGKTAGGIREHGHCSHLEAEGRGEHCCVTTASQSPKNSPAPCPIALNSVLTASVFPDVIYGSFSHPRYF